jgi:hypothetical protein
MLKDKSKINYLVDVFGLVCFLVLSVSGVCFLFIPAGPRAGWRQAGNFRGDLRDIHTIFGILMIVYGVIHFLLHWKWIVAMTKSFLKMDRKDSF